MSKRTYCQGVVKERNDHNIWEIIDTLTGTKKKLNSTLQSIANVMEMSIL